MISVIRKPGIGCRCCVREWWWSAISVLAVILALAVPDQIFTRVLFAWHAIGSAFGPALVLRLAGVQLSANGSALVDGGGLRSDRDPALVALRGRPGRYPGAAVAVARGHADRLVDPGKTASHGMRWRRCA